MQQLSFVQLTDNMVLFLLILFFILVYFFITKNHDYWSKRNVKHDRPIPLFGNNLRNQLGLKSVTEMSVELYNKYPDEKIVGFYRGREPELMIRDPEIIRHILNVDFAHFYPRGLGRDPDLEPLLLNLFHVDGDRWRLLRQRLTPAFTTSKLKNMFPLIVKCADKLQTVCGEIVKGGGECDSREVMARFTTEFIGACGFGIEMDTINNEDSRYRELGMQIFHRSLKDIILFVIWELFPELRKLFRVVDSTIDDSIEVILKAVREQRNLKPSGRNDFVDLLLELETMGTIRGKSIEKVDESGNPLDVEMEMDLKVMVAQLFVFFAAGFETSSSATSFTLHELAFHPEIQEKIQEEIDQILSKYDNKLCFDAIAEMTLLDMAFKESMRMFPSLGNLHRVCARRYTIPGTDVTIDPKVKILIPTQAIQNDEQYFDHPEEYRPERFAPHEVKNRNKYLYMPFGEGPRMCIGARLGQMQSLAGLAAILQKFTVEPSRKTQRKLQVRPTSNVVQGVKNGVPLKFKLRAKH